MPNKKGKIMGEETKKPITVIRRRSASYTTHYVNGCSFQHPEPKEEIGEDSVIIMDYLFRSNLAGEPFKASFNDEGWLESEDHERMLVDEILVGVAVTKADLVRICLLALELCCGGEFVVLTGEEAAAYKENADAECAEEG